MMTTKLHLITMWKEWLNFFYLYCKILHIVIICTHVTLELNHTKLNDKKSGDDNRCEEYGCDRSCDLDYLKTMIQNDDQTRDDEIIMNKYYTPHLTSLTHSLISHTIKVLFFLGLLKYISFTEETQDLIMSWEQPELGLTHWLQLHCHNKYPLANSTQQHCSSSS